MQSRQIHERQEANGWWLWGREGRLLNGYEVSFWGDESILELDGSDGGTPLSVYSVSLNCILQLISVM